MVGLCDEAVDGGLKIDHASEDTTLQSLLGKFFAKNPFDCIEPGARGRRSGKRSAGAGRAIETPLDACGQRSCRGSACTVSSSLVTCASMALRKRMNFCGWTMALHISANDLAFQYVEGCEQCRCAVALVVMGHCAASAPLHRQARLGAVDGLDLRLFVDREDDGVGGRIDIKLDNIAQLVDKLRVLWRA